MANFNALVLDEIDGKVKASIREVGEADLPPGDVTVEVSHSTLNYKDGLILGGIGRLVRKYPHVPGIDFVGTVLASASPRWKPGDQVILTGWRVGETQWGGYARLARVRGDWLVRLPAGLTPVRAMAVGTAGFTAALAIMALERRGLQPAQGQVLVTGGAGGLGSIAIALLAHGGHDIVASTGRAETHDYLRSLGAGSIIDRTELAAPPAKPLLSERWIACVDTIGGTTLASVLASLRYGGAVAACGNAGGNELVTNVLPFILRGINLIGIDSVMQPLPVRDQVWARIARDLQASLLDSMTTIVGLGDLPEFGARILKGQVRGRVVIDLGRA